MTSVQEVIATLKKLGKKSVLDSFARFGIAAPKAFGVMVGDIEKLAKTIGRSHELAEGLWKTGWYEARMLAAFVDEADQVTPEQMDRWSDDFDNWGICDTVCFKLFDRTPHAFAKIRQWSRHRGEFQKRAAFALLSSVALHDKRAADAPFTKTFRLIERAATDNRNFVKKGVSWALRSVGHRNAELHDAALQLAHRLADSADTTARWIGKDVLRDLTRPLVIRRISNRAARSKSAT